MADTLSPLLTLSLVTFVYMCQSTKFLVLQESNSFFPLFIEVLVSYISLQEKKKDGSTERAA